MSAPNGQRGATMPSNSSEIVPWNGTVPRATEFNVAEGGGQSTNSASAPQAMRTSIHAGEQQAAGGSSNAAGQNRDQQAPGSGRGRGAPPPSNSTSRASSRAPTEIARGQGTVVSMPRKRDFDSMAAAYREMVLSKRRKIQTRAIPRDQLEVETNALGSVAQMQPKNSHGPSTNSMTQSSSSFMGIDAKVRLSTGAGIQTVLDVGSIVEQKTGSRDVLITVTPLRDSDAEDRRTLTDPEWTARPGRPGVRSRQIEELPCDDGDAAQRPAQRPAQPDRVNCMACGRPDHETRKCHIPSSDGTTVICPYHGVSVEAPKGIATHDLDGHHRHPPNDQQSLLYCTNMVDLEEALIYDRHGVYRHRLRKAFDKFLVERIRKPFCRVFKNGNCPISIAIDYSNTFCAGQMPEQLKKGWPYTKRDATDPAISNRLKECREHNWQDMPKGELEKMSWEQIKEAYGDGRIERQIHHPNSGR